MNILSKFFIYIVIILFSLTACVSKKIYLKSETDLKACNEREINNNAQRVSLNKHIEFLKKQIHSLEEDTTGLALRIRQFEQKITEYNQIISSPLSEKEKLNLLLKIKNENK